MSAPSRCRELDLPEVLEYYRFKTTLSAADIARGCWLDESYLSRLFSGERLNPSRDALIRLGAFGLRLAVADADELLLAAEYRPLVPLARVR